MELLFLGAIRTFSPPFPCHHPSFASGDSTRIPTRPYRFWFPGGLAFSASSTHILWWVPAASPPSACVQRHAYQFGRYVWSPRGRCSRHMRPTRSLIPISFHTVSASPSLLPIFSCALCFAIATSSHLASPPPEPLLCHEIGPRPPRGSLEVALSFSPPSHSPSPGCRRRYSSVAVTPSAPTRSVPLTLLLPIFFPSSSLLPYSYAAADSAQVPSQLHLLSPDPFPSPSFFPSSPPPHLASPTLTSP